MRHLIIGNGPAGVVAAETLRARRPADEIVLVGDEDAPSYSRMAIPYLLTGSIGEPGTYLRKDPAHWESLRVTTKRGRVTRLDVEGDTKRAAFDDGSTLDFDTALVCTGSTPVRPPVPGLDSPYVQTCWTLEDARRIQALARPGARVLQMGAGFIGCIIMEALALRGVKLSVVEMGDRMVPRMMGPAAGNMIRRWCEKKGVRVFTGTRVEAIETGSGDDPVYAVLSNGTREPFDLVIQATGVKPNIGFLAGTPIRCLQGVLVDEHMQTSVPGVYAAGDCAEAFDVASGKTIVSAIQPNAVDQARVAAIGMTGGHAVSRGVTQINVLDTLGLISASFGRWEGVPGGEHVELVDDERFRMLRLEFDGDVLVGANSLGMTEHVGVLRGLVEGAVPLGEWKDHLIAEPGRLMEAYLATAQAQEEWQGRARGTSRS